MSDDKRVFTAGAPFSQTLEGKMANLEAANAALKKKIVERDTELVTLRAELEKVKDALMASVELTNIREEQLLEELAFDTRQIMTERDAARQSRKRLVQLVRSFVEIRKTIGKVAKVIRERDQAQADARELAKYLIRVTYIGMDGRRYMTNSTRNDELAQAIDRVLSEHGAKYLKNK